MTTRFSGSASVDTLGPRAHPITSEAAHANDTMVRARPVMGADVTRRFTPRVDSLYPRVRAPLVSDAAPPKKPPPPKPMGRPPPLPTQQRREQPSMTDREKQALTFQALGLLNE